jgi:hypothetical protein
MVHGFRGYFLGGGDGVRKAERSGRGGKDAAMAGTGATATAAAAAAAAARAGLTGGLGVRAASRGVPAVGTNRDA